MDALQIRALQGKLRTLGYLRTGVDGRFGDGTAAAIRALQHDLLHNDGASSAGDGRAPVAITSFNTGAGGKKAVDRVDGEVSDALLGCIDAMMQDSRVAKLPSASTPAAANQAALAAIRDTPNPLAPAPFIAAIAQQESGGQHFHVPPPGDDDTFVTVGLDRNDQGDRDCITSRGYGVAQYTLFHHPPRAEEVEDFIADPVRNAANAFHELRDKFDRFVVGPADRADDRRSEHPLLPLRLCKYVPSDVRYLHDCRNCAVAARKISIARGTPAYSGAAISYQPTQYYASATYSNVPDRADFPCDWPYAARRYNGSGVNSFHYQTRILLNLLAQPMPPGS